MEETNRKNEGKGLVLQNTTPVVVCGKIYRRSPRWDFERGAPMHNTSTVRGRGKCDDHNVGRVCSNGTSKMQGRGQGSMIITLREFSNS